MKYAIYGVVGGQLLTVVGGNSIVSSDVRSGYLRADSGRAGSPSPPADGSESRPYDCHAT